MAKFIADENFQFPTVKALRAAGHDVMAIAELAAQAKDPAVLQLALAEDRILLTRDKDFGELIFRRGASATAGIVLFRIRAQNLAEFTRQVLATLAKDIEWRGGFSVVTNHRVRRRKLGSP